jgi:hypothetical protein
MQSWRKVRLVLWNFGAACMVLPSPGPEARLAASTPRVVGTELRCSGPLLEE